MKLSEHCLARILFNYFSLFSLPLLAENSLGIGNNPFLLSKINELKFKEGTCCSNVHPPFQKGEINDLRNLNRQQLEEISSQLLLFDANLRNKEMQLNDTLNRKDQVCN